MAPSASAWRRAGLWLLLARAAGDNVTSPPRLTPHTEHTFAETVTVHATCDDAGAVVHYTIDGSEPNADSSIITDRGVLIRHLGNTTFRAVAVQPAADAVGIPNPHAGWANSRVVSRWFVVEPLCPTPTLAFDGDVARAAAGADGVEQLVVIGELGVTLALPDGAGGAASELRHADPAATRRRRRAPLVPGARVALAALMTAARAASCCARSRPRPAAGYEGDHGLAQRARRSCRARARHREPRPRNRRPPASPSRWRRRAVATSATPEATVYYTTDGTARSFQRTTTAAATGTTTTAQTGSRPSAAIREPMS